MKGFDVLIKLFLKLPKFGKKKIIAQKVEILSSHHPKVWKTKIEIVAMLLDMSTMSFEGKQ
jgi:ribosomal protein L30E